MNEDKCWLLMKEITDKGAHIIFQWVPSHVGLEHNELVDISAKNATAMNQNNAAIEYKTIKAKIYKDVRQKWTCAHTKWKYEKDSEATLSRADRSEVCRIRSGDSMLVRSYWHKIGLSESDLCEHCGFDNPETAEHLILSCPRWHQQRLSSFGTVSPNQKDIPATAILHFLRGIGRLPAGRR